jgi:hypothetical protein
MATDRRIDKMIDLSSRQIVENVLRALEAAARDVDERRVPLDGRVQPQCYGAEDRPLPAAPTPVTAK